MKILLTTLNAKYIHLNLAIRLLYDQNRHHTGLSWKEFTIKEDRDAIANFCKNYEVVAFSCYIWNITQTLDVARRIKKLNPDTKILLGGPEVSYDWEDIIVRDEVDFIITGEGEVPFQQFLQNYPKIENIANFIRKDKEEIHFFEEKQTFNLTNYENSNPYQYDEVDELKNKVLYIETSRGCPYKCEFCLASLDNKVRYLPLKTIENQLLYLMQHGRVIKFLDRTFNIKKDFTLHIFKFILAHHRPENVFQFEITADILHPEIISFIQKNVPKNLFRFEIGIQTVNQKANLEVSRKQSFEKTKGIILALNDKVEMHLDLIVGLPLDEWDDIKYSFEEVFKLYPPELQLGFLKFLKGTPVRYKYEQHGFVFDPEPPYQIIESKYLSKQQLADLEIIENALEIYWNKKRACRTLQYVCERYSIFEFLLKLGQYFIQRKSFHQYILTEVYEILYQFAEENYPSDIVLKEMVGVDYYLTHKKKPKPLFLHKKIEKDSVKIEKLEHLNRKIKQRQMVFTLNFNLEKWSDRQELETQPHIFVVNYDGVNLPTFFTEIDFSGV